MVTASKVWLITATRLTGVDVTAIATAVSEVHIREGFLCGHIGSSDTIADQVIGSDVELGVEHAGNCARCNVHHVVGEPPPVRKALRRRRPADPIGCGSPPESALPRC